MQYLYGAHEDFIVNPRTFLQLFLLNLLGSLNIFPSFLLQLFFLLDIFPQQLTIFLDFIYKFEKINSLKIKKIS